MAPPWAPHQRSLADAPPRPPGSGGGEHRCDGIRSAGVASPAARIGPAPRGGGRPRVLAQTGRFGQASVDPDGESAGLEEAGWSVRSTWGPPLASPATGPVSSLRRAT